jgi:peroxiredoxin
MIPNKSSSYFLPCTALVLALLLVAGCGEQRAQSQAPDFSLPLLDGGESVSLQDYRGQVVYLTFWASWCLPCRQEMPYLAQLLERHQGEGFEVLAINVDQEVELARAFVEEYGITFPVLYDPERSVAPTYRVPGYPTHFVIDRGGKIRYTSIGFDLNDVRAVSGEVATLIAEPVDVE